MVAILVAILVRVELLLVTKGALIDRKTTLGQGSYNKNVSKRGLTTIDCVRFILWLIIILILVFLYIVA